MGRTGGHMRPKTLSEGYLVPEVGVEPTHGCPWQILSLLRLPIPPHRQGSWGGARV